MEDSDVGDELFERVAELEPSLCAQITGMLLELDPAVISDILNSPDQLLQAVEKAKSAYLQFLNIPANCAFHNDNNNSSSCNNTMTFTPDSEVEKLGERLFEKIVKIHPEDAPQITGMILEMRVEQIKLVLTDEDLFSKTIEKALRVLHS